MDIATRRPLGPTIEDRFAELLGLLRSRRTLALVGAGCSTESGIPDYRGPDGRLKSRKPMQVKEFVGSPQGRARYWSRSTVGWPAFSAARPNAAHHALAALEDGGVVSGLITQNVDGLHHEAGSREIVELHGSLAWVRCLDCGSRVRRTAFQERLMSLNATWLDGLSGTGEVPSAPDGDADLPARALETFLVPACDDCGGVMKPDVVFFGENVPKERVDAAWTLMEGAEALLVVGSSLTVFSGRRFVYGARKAGIPIAILNLGQTRADELAHVKVEERLGDVLPRLARELTGTDALRS